MVSSPTLTRRTSPGSVACFVFDGRTSRRYSDPDGRIISDDQFADFESFCRQIANDRRVRFLVIGTAVPFINLKDIVEELGSQAPKALTDLMAGIRDDIRDSWHSKGNREGLKRLVKILRDSTGAVPTSTSSTSAATSMSRMRSRSSRSVYEGAVPVHDLGDHRIATTRQRPSPRSWTSARQRSARCSGS